jgi:hypothetical protein
MTNEDYTAKDIVDAIENMSQRLGSENESDRNGEVAYVTDGLFAIARAIEDLAKAIREKP